MSRCTIARKSYSPFLHRERIQGHMRGRWIGILRGVTLSRESGPRLALSQDAAGRRQRHQTALRGWPASPLSVRPFDPVRYRGRTKLAAAGYSACEGRTMAPGHRRASQSNAKAAPRKCLCLVAYDAGYLHRTDGDGYAFPVRGEGFLIDCRHCRRPFNSKGLRCCSVGCERTIVERAAITAAHDFSARSSQPRPSRECAQNGRLMLRNLALASAGMITTTTMTVGECWPRCLPDL